MAAALVGGAAVGAAFGELLKAIVEVGGRAVRFKSTLDYLGHTLNQIAPIIKEIEQHNINLGRPKKELESLIKQMEEGAKLVRKCSKVPKINPLAPVLYESKLEKLINSLMRFFIVDMQVQSTRDLKETLLKVTRVLSAVNKLPQVVTQDRAGTIPAKIESKIYHSTKSQLHDANALETNSAEEAVEQIGQVTRKLSTDTDPVRIDVVESDLPPSTATQPAQNAAGANSAKQGVEKSKAKAGKKKSSEQLLTVEKRFLDTCLPESTEIGESSHEVKEANPKPTPLKEPLSVYCKACGTCIKQNDDIFCIEGYSCCNLCHNEQFHPEGLVSYSFNIDDLLKASAEELGDGSYGITYRATLEDGRTVAVKSFREVRVSEREFKKQVEIVRTVPHHPNVIPLRACCYRKDENYLIYDYMAADSLSKLLHGTQEINGTPLDWDSRMKISLGAAEGIAHIHSIGEMNFVHGNIKSSNVLVTANIHVCISDFGIAGLANCVEPFRNDGYRAPEVIETGKLTQKSDVYSFGVVLGELLTSESPTEIPWHALKWVQRLGEWTEYIFDTDPKDPIQQKQMLLMMQLTMQCVERKPESRPSMGEVVKEMERIKLSKDQYHPKYI